MLSTNKILVALSALGLTVLAGQAAPVQIRYTYPTAQMSKLLRTNPNGIPNLAACRQIGIAGAHGGQLKSRLIKQHVKGLTSPKKEKRVAYQSGGQSQTQVTISDLLQTGPYEPAGYMVSSVPLVVTQPDSGLIEEKLTGCCIRHRGNANWTDLEEEGLLLERGEILLAVSHDRFLKLAQDTSVSIEAGSVVLVRKTEGLLRVINLTDTKRDAVQISSGCQTFSLRSGQECLIAKSQDEIKTLCKRDGLGRRFQSQCKSSTDALIFVGDVSIPSILKHHDLAGRLYNSERASDRKLSLRLMKTAACLAHCGRSLTPYKWEQD